MLDLRAYGLRSLAVLGALLVPGTVRVAECAAPAEFGASHPRRGPSVSPPPSGSSAPGERGGPGLALLAAKVLTCAREGVQAVDRAVLLIKDGTIEAVGPAPEVAIPAGYEIVDLGEQWLAPGLVDLHCHSAGANILAGANDINDLVFMTNPELRVTPAVIPDNPMLREGVAGGVTSVLYIPGSGSNMGGSGVLLKTAFEHYDEMVLRDPGSLKLAQAGNPERWAMGVGRSLMNWNTRNTFRRGLAYAAAWQAYEDGRGEKPEKNVQFDVFRELAAKRTQVSVHTQMYQVVLMTLTMVRVEFGLDCYIDHGEWWGSRTAPLAKSLGVQAIVGPREIDRTIPGFIDTDGKIVGIASEYQKAGHPLVGFNTDSPIVPEAEFSLQAAMGVRYGFENDELQALRGLTIVPAIAAGIAERVGSLEPGKDADVLVTDGDPADPRTTVARVFIDGRSVYDVAKRTEALVMHTLALMLALVPGSVCGAGAWHRTDLATAAVGSQAPAPRTEQEPGTVGGSGLALIAAKALCVPYEGEQVIDHPVLLVKDGKIEALGPASTTAIPAGYEVRDLGERWLMPGMIDLHNHVGGTFDINDVVYVTNPELKVHASVVPANPNLKRALASGVTTVLYIPGSGSNMGGQGVLVKTGLDRYEDALVRNPGSLKVAQWGNPESWTVGVGKAFENWSLRDQFRRGMAYARAWEEFEKSGGERPEKDNRLEVFRELSAKRTQVSTHTQVFQVVLMTITMIRREFGVDVYIDHGEMGGYKAGKLAKELGVAAIIGPREIDAPVRFMINWTGTNPERVQGLAAAYQEAGVTDIGFNTDAPVIPAEELFLQAGMSVRYGLDNSRLETVRGLTIVPARTAGIADKVGSLEPGKEADVLVITGDPADPRTSVEAVFIEGRRVYDTARDPRRF